MGGNTSRVHKLEHVKRDVSAKNLAYNLKGNVGLFFMGMYFVFQYFGKEYIHPLVGYRNPFAWLFFYTWGMYMAKFGNIFWKKRSCGVLESRRDTDEYSCNHLVIQKEFF